MDVLLRRIYARHVVTQPFVMLHAGIKPCVSAFGGDQFAQRSEREVTSYFLAFYFAINFGSFFSYIITPLARYTCGCVAVCDGTDTVSAREVIVISVGAV